MLSLVKLYASELFQNGFGTVDPCVCEIYVALTGHNFKIDIPLICFFVAVMSGER